jgi:hypothetical protein
MTIMSVSQMLWGFMKLVEKVDQMLLKIVAMMKCWPQVREKHWRQR